jgi:hypothetical protein
MTQSTRIYRHSAAGTDWAALALGAGLGLTLALQATTLRSGDFKDFYSVVVTFSRLAALVGTYLSVVGIFLVARIPIVERGVGHDRLVTWHRKLGPWSLYLIGAHVFLIVLGFAGQDQIPLYKEMWQFLTFAVMVAGQDAAKWFGQPELAGYQVFAVNRHEQSAWSI